MITADEMDAGVRNAFRSIMFDAIQRGIVAGVVAFGDGLAALARGDVGPGLDAIAEGQRLLDAAREAEAWTTDELSVPSAQTRAEMRWEDDGGASREDGR